MVTKFSTAFSMNEAELMEFYNFKGKLGKFRLRMFVLKNWILHSLSYFSAHSGFAIRMQEVRGVNVGKNCHFCPYVHIDLIYPHLVNIEDNVTLGTNCMIFAHMNPTANLFLKTGEYKRKVEPVTIKSGAVLTPGSIVMAGITIGKNSIVSPGSVVTQDVPDYCIVVGNPARVVKKIDH
ncbi:acyltransferase [Nitrosopumilus sp.]|uniref:acyltransferase n=1 Tax=Nitrosopumilus sp. TaxID=2024843 RepID=UPI003D0C6BEF